MADRSSFENFLETANAAVAGRVGELLAENKVKHLGEGQWSLQMPGEDTFETPGSDDRFMAAWYGFYVRQCRRRGLEVGPFEDVV